MSVSSLPWYYSESQGIPGQVTVLAGEEWHHCHHVLRMGVGEHLILFDGKGQIFEGMIAMVARNEGQIEIIADCTAVFPSPRSYQVTVAFSPTKNIDRTEFAVEKLVELGVNDIVFLDCEHAERSRIRLDRMEKIVMSAAKQSRKSLLPRLHDLVSPNLWVTRFKKEQPDAQVFCCHLALDSTPLCENYQVGRDVLLLIGPEGGFSTEETEQLVHRGAKLVTLGRYRLRVETAVIAGCNSIHTLNDLKK